MSNNQSAVVDNAWPGPQGSISQSTDMAPVIRMLNQWGMETPFAEDDVVGTSVLAVSVCVWGGGGGGGCAFNWKDHH